MKRLFTDRVRAWLLRMGFAYDEPGAVFVVDDAVVDAMHAGNDLVLSLRAPPALVRWRESPGVGVAGDIVIASNPLAFPMRGPRRTQ